MTQSAALAPQTATRTLHASLFHKPFILLTLQPCCFNRFSSNFFAIIPLAQESSAPSPSLWKSPNIHSKQRSYREKRAQKNSHFLSQNCHFSPKNRRFSARFCPFSPNVENSCRKLFQRVIALLTPEPWPKCVPGRPQTSAPNRSNNQRAQIRRSPASVPHAPERTCSCSPYEFSRRAQTQR
jgi:hypothetical protein